MWLKALGLAKVAYLFDDYKYTDLFKSGEAIAQNAQINIWSMPGYDNQANGFDMSVVSNKTKLSKFKNEIGKIKGKIRGR